MIVLDSTALIGLEKRNPKAVAIVGRAFARESEIIVPATVLAQCWRNDPRQHAVARLLKSHTVRVVDLTEAHARAVGVTLGSVGSPDVVDAHLVVLARALRATLVVTSDPHDLTTLDPAVRLYVV